MTPDQQILQLAPHENPLRRRTDMDGEPMSFQVDYFGSSREIIGQCVSEDGYGSVFFFQFADEPQFGSLVYSGLNEDCAQPYMDYGLTIPTGIFSTVQKNFTSNIWGRYFVLDESLHLATESNCCNTLFLNWNGLGMLRRNSGGSARFRWNSSCPEQIWNSPGSLLAQFVDQTQELNSEPRFAFDWAQLSDAERLDLVFPLRTGTYQDWSFACALLPLAFVRWPDESYEKLYARFQINGEVQTGFYEESRRASYQRIQNLPLQKFHHWLCNYFSPQRNEKTCECYLCARQWAETARMIYEVRMNQPTQHERLEALLQLRDWLGERATPSEIDALLRAE